VLQQVCNFCFVLGLRLTTAATITVVAVNQDHKKNNHAQKTPENILGKPFSIKGKTQQSFAILPREDPPFHHQT
jgi:hypothetical protein